MRTYDDTAAYAVGEIQALKYWARAETSADKSITLPFGVVTLFESCLMLRTCKNCESHKSATASRSSVYVEPKRVHYQHRICSRRAAFFARASLYEV